MTVKADVSHPEFIEVDESVPAWVKDIMVSRHRLEVQVSQLATELSRYSSVLEEMQKVLKEMN